MRSFLYTIIILGICVYGIMVVGPYLLLGLIFILGIRFILHLIANFFKNSSQQNYTSDDLRKLFFKMISHQI